jgi:hypothetical protein
MHALHQPWPWANGSAVLFPYLLDFSDHHSCYYFIYATIGGVQNQAKWILFLKVDLTVLPHVQE